MEVLTSGLKSWIHIDSQPYTCLCKHPANGVLCRSHVLTRGPYIIQKKWNQSQQAIAAPHRFVHESNWTFTRKEIDHVQDDSNKVLLMRLQRVASSSSPGCSRDGIHDSHKRKYAKSIFMAGRWKHATEQGRVVVCTEIEGVACHELNVWSSECTVHSSTWVARDLLLYNSCCWWSNMLCNDPWYSCAGSLRRGFSVHPISFLVNFPSQTPLLLLVRELVLLIDFNF